MENTKEVLRGLANGASVTAIAEAIETPQSTLNRQINKDDVELGVLVKFARYYRVNLLDLLADLGEITREEAASWKNKASVSDFSLEDLSREVYERTLRAAVAKRDFGLAAKRGDERIGKDQLPDWD